ncbi:MAG: aldehyde dehydrogenase family protein [Candidatus Omnitrophica bacterium]|nr:aldehyde dehydrogenase family protein [Candidatus Omnitrophota bacterium]
MQNVKKLVNQSTVKLPKTQLFIDGKWRAAQSGKTFETNNPATGEMITKIAEAGEADIDLAARAARRAFEGGAWPGTRASERKAYLHKIAELIRTHQEELAQLEMLDAGKPIANTRAIDIPASAGAFDYYAEWADKITGETVPVDPNYFSYTLREPLGVIGAITPWNFPLCMASQKIAPALAMGNTVVLKPAEQTPLTALRLAELIAKAGVPEGVVNVLPGIGECAGAALVRHPEVDGISFTGEYRTGQEIMKNAAATLKRLHFELGGKSPNIIFADADLEAAAEFACDGIFFNQGEVCCSGSRLFVDEKIKKPFTEALLEKAKSWQPGNPANPKTGMGAIVSEDQFKKVMSYIDIGKKEGAKLLLDGRAAAKSKGYFIGPTIFDGVKNNMRLAQEEIFGPVLAQIAFKNFDAVIREANHTFYGLAAAVWTRDVQKAHRAARALKAGVVWVNCYGEFDHAMPFGGYKMSGFGREGGRYAFDFYTQVKSVWMKL